MTSVLKMDLYKFATGLDKDPRVKGFFMQSFTTPLLIIFAYLSIIFILLPNLMRNRKPFKLLLITRIYNIIQIILSIYFTCSMSYLAYYKLGYSVICEPMNLNDYRPDMITLIKLRELYLWLRVFDMIETIIFHLRGKTAQVTVLHVYHHISVVLVFWSFHMYGLGSQAQLSASINSAVHIIMYTYYLLATFPNLRPYLWWKKYLTTFQIIQFVIMIVHYCIPIFVDCGYPTTAAKQAGVLAVTLLILFSNFYGKTYFKKKSIDDKKCK